MIKKLQTLKYLLTLQESNSYIEELIFCLENIHCKKDAENLLDKYPPNEANDFDYRMNMSLASIIYYLFNDDYNLNDISIDLGLPLIESKLIISDISLGFILDKLQVDNRQYLRQILYKVFESDVKLDFGEISILKRLNFMNMKKEITSLCYIYYYLSFVK